MGKERITQNSPLTKTEKRIQWAIGYIFTLYMTKAPDIELDANKTFDTLKMEISGGRCFGFISTPHGQEEKPMLEVILHETKNGDLMNEEANGLIDALMWQKRLRRIEILATDFIAIHEAQIISQEDLMDLANRYLEDDESKKHEAELAAIGIDRRALQTMVIDLSQLKFPVDPQVTQTRRFLSGRALAIAGAVLAIGGATAAGMISMNRAPEGKQATPVQPQTKPTTARAKPLPESKPAQATAPTPPLIEEATPEPKLANAPATAPEAPSFQTLPLINKGNGRGGLLFDEAATTEAWKKLGFSVTQNTDTEGQKVYSLKDGQGNEFIVKDLAANKGKTSIVANKKE